MIAALSLMLVLTAACGEAPPGRAGGGPTQSPEPKGSTPEPDEQQKYRATATVLQDEKDRRPEFCLGGVATSLPPQCGGPPLEGWDWNAVADEERRSGVIWGDYEVTGYYDGRVFTVLDVGPPRSGPDADYEPIEDACEEPAGGWERPNPEMDSRSHLDRAIAKARREPDFAGAWIGYIGEPSDLAPEDEIILNLAFTGDLDVHEREVREDWGGPLCLAQRERTLDELLEIQRELHDSVAEELGLEVLGSSAGEYDNKVQLEVILFHPDTQQKLDERYGEGVVELRARLQPVP